MKSPSHILITGAAGAIGQELALQLAQRYPTAKLTLIDKNAEGVRDVATRVGERAWVGLWDLSQPEALASQWSILVDARGPVDLLINCAGIMEIKSFANTGWSLGSKLLSINLVSPLRLMDLAIPSMLAQGGGAVINVSSMAGKTPIRGCTYYGATKAGLAMASEIARLELRQKAVQVMTVYPGPIYSGLEAHARSQVRQGPISRYIPTGAPEDIAARIVRAYEENRARVIFPEVYRVGYWLLGVASWFTSRFSPEPIE